MIFFYKYINNIRQQTDMWKKRADFYISSAFLVGTF